jgi:hypothetical protein
MPIGSRVANKAVLNVSRESFILVSHSVVDGVVVDDKELVEFTDSIVTLKSLKKVNAPKKVKVCRRFIALSMQ